MDQTLQNILDADERLSQRLRTASDSPIRKIASFFAHSGDSWFWVAGLGVTWLISFFFYSRSWCYESLLLTICIVIQALFVFFIKFFFRRQRPASDWGQIYRRQDPHSFPSGHATRAAMLAVIAISLEPVWLAWALAIWAPLMCMARISLGVHYLSDVLAGLVLGILLGCLLPRLAVPILAWFPFLY